MSPKSKKEYLAAIVKRYKEAPKAQKQLILNEFCEAYPLSSKARHTTAQGL